MTHWKITLKIGNPKLHSNQFVTENAKSFEKCVKYIQK